MWDQNPLLHKLSIDDLARDHQNLNKGQDHSNGISRLAGIAATLTVVVAAVFMIGANAV